MLHLKNAITITQGLSKHLDTKTKYLNFKIDHFNDFIFFTKQNGLNS